MFHEGWMHTAYQALTIKTSLLLQFLLLMTGIFKAPLHSVISFSGICWTFLNTLIGLKCLLSLMQAIFILSIHYNISFKALKCCQLQLQNSPYKGSTPWSTWREVVQHHAFLTLTLDNCRWQFHHTWATVNHVTHSTGGWMGPRATLHAMEKIKKTLASI